MQRGSSSAPDGRGARIHHPEIPAIERRQARSRFGLSLLAVVLACMAVLAGHSPFLLAAALGLLAASTLLWAACLRPVTGPAGRRIPAILVDVGAATFLATQVGDAPIFTYPLFLAIAADHGLRYHRPYVTIASLIAVAGFSAVLLTSGAPPASAWGAVFLLLALLAVPHHLGRLTRGLAAERAELEAQRDAAEFQATHDPLTGLPNRAALDFLLKKALAHASRTGAELTVALLEVEGLRTLNQDCGRDAGDQALVRAGEAMRSALRESDTIARVAGDRFVVLLEGTGHSPAIAPLVDRLVACFVAPSGGDQCVPDLGCRCGISIYPRDGTGAEALLDNAAVALRVASARGRNRFAFYDMRLSADAVRQAQLRDGLQQAVGGHQLGLVFQPIVDERSGRICAAEALLRWCHPEFGVMPAGRFMDLAESSGFAVPIGNWAIAEALRTAAAWRDQGRSNLSIHVNVSSSQLRQADFAERLTAWLADSGMAAETLVLEVAEHAVCRQQERLTIEWRKLRSIGVRIALDNFGTASSSLTMLRDLPVDVIKIDRALNASLPSSPRNCALVDTLLTLGDRLGHDIVACGVERLEQREWLALHGCRFLQGHWLGQALAADEFLAASGAAVDAAPSLAGIAQREIKAGG
jgi:diguanylate cyclase (GGDEF)-like protein